MGRVAAISMLIDFGLLWIYLSLTMTAEAIAPVFESVQP